MLPCRVFFLDFDFIAQIFLRGGPPGLGRSPTSTVVSRLCFATLLAYTVQYWIFVRFIFLSQRLRIWVGLSSVLLSFLKGRVWVGLSSVFVSFLAFLKDLGFG